MNLQNHISNFLTYLETQRRFSPRSIDTYRKSLDKFLALVGEDALLESFSEMQVKNFVWDLKMRQNLSPASICEHLAALKSFGKYLVRSSILEINPAGNVPMPKRPKRLVAFLGQKDLAEKNFDDLECSTLPQIRARVLLELIYGSGLRISECQSLTWDRLREKERLVRVLARATRSGLCPSRTPLWSA